MSDGQSLLLGLLLGMAMALGGYWRRALSESGAVAAALVGAVISGLGGWAWGILLMAFFAASSALSLYNPRRKAEIAAEKFSKGSRRDWSQVLANGGWAALMALLMWQRADAWVPAAFLGAVATVTADTWATELGTLSQEPPRLVTSGEAVPPGSSGGVTMLGTLAALVGGLFIGSLALALARVGGMPTLAVQPHWLPLIGAASGLAGAFADSVLGATVQRVYYCPHCDTETERPLHRCGIVTLPLRGWQWMDNDMVNFLASVAGSVVAAWLAVLLT
jgi:uncharacterized protein (TIGR00297 family)